MAQSAQEDDFDFEGLSNLYPAAPAQQTKSVAMPLLPPAPITSSQGKKATKRKAENGGSPRLTRSRLKQSQEPPSAAPTPPPAKKQKASKSVAKKAEVSQKSSNKILVKGTLGSGDNAVQVHPSTPLPPAKQASGSAVKVEVSEEWKKTILGQTSTADQWVMFQTFLRSAEAEKPAVPQPPMLPSPEPTPSTKKGSTTIISDDEDDSSSDDDMSVREVQEDTPENPFVSLEAQEAASSDDGSEDSEEEDEPHCQVTTPTSGDPLLYDTLVDLPVLAAVRLVGAGVISTYQFSTWVNSDPKFPAKAAKSCITFSRVQQYVNLARCDPNDLSLYAGGVKNTKRYLQVGNDSAVCLTPISVGLSLLRNTRTQWGQKEIGGFLHSHEFDRFMATLGMAYGVQELKPAIWNKLHRFTTYGNQLGDGAFNVEDADGSALVSTSRIVSKNGRILQPLSAEAKVPIFDATNMPKFRLDKVIEKLAKLDSKMSITEAMNKIGLKEQEDNINGGSFAVVAHTVTGSETTVEKDKVCGLTCNVQWVIVLAKGSYKAPL